MLLAIGGFASRGSLTLPSPIKMGRRQGRFIYHRAPVACMRAASGAYSSSCVRKVRPGRVTHECCCNWLRPLPGHHNSGWSSNKRGVNLSLIATERGHSQTRRFLLPQNSASKATLHVHGVADVGPCLHELVAPGLCSLPSWDRGYRPVDEDSGTCQGERKCHAGRLQSHIKPAPTVFPYQRASTSKVYSRSRGFLRFPNLGDFTNRRLEPVSRVHRFML